MTYSRRSIDIDGLRHSVPIPSASCIGPFVATSGIAGMDPAKGLIPDDLSCQVTLMFANLTSILAEAGCSLDNVLKMTFWAKNADARTSINEAWLKAFPDEHSRPARHVITTDLKGNLLVQLEALAVATP